MISARELSDERKERIRQWAEAGASLGEIQKRCAEEFGLKVTYLDARMLIADLGIALVEERNTPAPEKTPGTLGDDQAGAGPENGDATGVGAAGGGVTLSVSEVTPPGMIACGTVTFSDGEVAEWYFDQLGRLGLKAETPNYRPSAADVSAFQVELERVAQSQGF